MVSYSAIGGPWVRTRVVVKTLWSSMAFAQRLHSVLGDVTASLTAVMNAVRARRMRCEHCESAVRAQRIATKNSLGMQWNTMRGPLQCLGRCKAINIWQHQAIFQEKYQGFLAISRRSGKLKNSVATKWKRRLV